jgi:hypothetical protein
MPFSNLPTEYAANFKVVWCCLAIHQGGFAIPNLLYIKNNFGATHQHTFIVLVAFCSLASPYNDGITSCTCLVSPQLQMLMHTTLQNSKMKYYIHNVYECPCQLHTISPKGNMLCLPFHM